MRSVRLALGAGVLVVLVVLVTVLSQTDTRLAGTNVQTSVSGVTLSVYPDRRRCQLQDLPKAAAAVRVFARPLWESATGPVDVVVLEGRQELARARIATVTVTRIATVTVSDASVKATLDRVTDEEVIDARVCFINRAPTPVEFDGNVTPVLGGPANLGRQVFADDIRVDFLRKEKESWWALTPSVADRFGLIKGSLVGSWTLWALFALIGAGWVVTLRFLERVLRSS